MLTAQGFDVRCAASIAEFEQMQRDGPADLYLIDVGLPDGSGLAVVRELRQQGAAGVILLTGRGAETDQVVGLELGADDYVVKPFRGRELIARINAVLSRRVKAPKAQSPDATNHDFDGYRVCLQARSVHAPDGTELALTGAEFDLLSAFLRRRGEVMTRDQLVHLIKGREWELHDRAVDGLVSRLRRKLPPSRDRGPYIRTIHGVGYVFKD